MPEPDDTSKVEVNTDEETCDLKTIRNTIFFSVAAIAAGAAIYYVIKQNRKLKREKELLEYEVWG